MLRNVSLAIAIAASACNFSSPGGKGEGAPGLGEPEGDAPPGDAPPAGDAPDGGTDGSAADADDGRPAGDDEGDGPADQPLPPPIDTADDGDPTSDAGDGGDAGEGTEADSGGVAECDLGGIDVLWASEAELASPMQLVPATEAIDSPEVAVSAIPESGAITFALDLPCAGDYWVWGLVWDYAPGAWPNPDADSFYLDVGGPELVWRYGCQTSDAAGGLSWQPLERLDEQPCATTPIVLNAPQAGTYALELRNRELGFDSAVAGIAAIAISTDPTLDPYDAYSPY